jgi:hypothetical protein
LYGANVATVGRQTDQQKGTLEMTNFIEKARAGRTNALSSLTAGGGETPRNRAMSRHDPVTFVSRRGQGRMATIVT